MKKLLFAAIIILSASTFSAAQDIAPAPADKAVVYFVRTSSLGFAINFSYFDSAQLIGRFNGPKYIRYECAPGPHLFWARSENRDFVNADLEAGKIYFLEAVPQMGAMKAAVRLEPVDPANEKKMEKIMKLISKKPSEPYNEAEMAAESKEFTEVITKGLAKYQEEKEKGSATPRLEKSMFYTK